MAGICGAAAPSGWDAATAVSEATGSLRFHIGARVDVWHDTHAGLACVHGAKDKPETQPIFARGENVCLVMFGECYGYEAERRALEGQGHVFRSLDSDAEFCMRLYEAHGEQAFAKLSGSFCIALYDAQRRELLLVSDRLGSRPLFYGEAGNGRLIFGTQVAAVLSAPAVSRELDDSAAVEFCALQRVLGTKTYHHGVRLLAPGSVLRHRDGKVAVSAYWYPDYRPQPGSLDEYAEELALAMKRAMGHVQRDSDRVAMLLSGGLDARMAVAAAGDRLVCYTFADYVNPEAEAARRIAEARGFEFRFLQREADHYANLLDTAVDLGNGMHSFNHAHALGFIDKVSADCDVVTHGYVPELLFRGYSLPKVPHRVMGIDLGKKLDPSLTAEQLPARLYRRGYSLLGKGVEDLFAPRVRSELEATLLRSAAEVLAETDSHATDLYDKFLWPDVRHHARYPSMLFEMALRPFMRERGLVFYNEVIDLHLKLPVDKRADNRLWLRALERLSPRIAHAPDANTRHSPFTPVPVAAAIDRGRDLASRFPLLGRLLRTEHAGAAPGASQISWPRYDWLIRNNARLRALVSDTLRDPAALPPRLFDADGVNALLDDHLAGRGSHRTILFALLTFGTWHRKYGRT